MAKDKDPKKSDAPQETKAPKPKSEGGGNKLFIMMFAGVMIIQLVIIVVAVFFLLNKSAPSNSGDKSEADSKKDKTEKKDDKKGEEKKGEGENVKKEEPMEEIAPFNYKTGDLIINPKGTGGKRFLLAQVAVYVGTKEFAEECTKERSGQIDGIINHFLSSQPVEILEEMDMRDSIAVEIKGRLNRELGGDKVKKVFFSKFVIQ